MKYDITALGDILIDFSPMGVDEAGDPVFVRKAGGAPLNLLATVAKFGGRAAFIGKVGEDMFGPELGHRAMEFLEKLIPLYEYFNRFAV